MERSIAAMGQINLWNLFFRNTWKGALKLIFVATADSFPQNFMKPVRVSGAGFVDDEVSNIKATGSITKVGSTKNTITYTENSDFDKENYDINIKEGTLTITQNIDEIVVTAHNASKIYDGTPLTESNYKVKGLPDGFTAKVTTSGSITDFGEINNVIQTVVIKDSDGKDVTDQFANIVQKKWYINDYETACDPNI